MYRLHFTTDDLAGVRVQQLGPLAESLLSLHQLRSRLSDPMFGAWRRRILATDGLRHDVLSAIVPGKPPFLDLVSLCPPAGSIAEGAEFLLASSPVDVQYELDHYAEQHGQLPGVLRDLATDLGARRDLVSSLVGFHDRAIRPNWTRIQARLDADRYARSQTVLNQGIDGLLANLHPDIRWERPVLTIPKRHGGDLWLNGRGIVLVPSFFERTPVFLRPADPDGQYMLVYPVAADLEIWAASEPNRALANLLGKTRASVLMAISDGTATTSQLAGRTGTSAASISQHTAVLRDAGLITSHRHRNTVQHMLASAGAVLLNGA